MHYDSFIILLLKKESKEMKNIMFEFNHSSE